MGNHFTCQEGHPPPFRNGPFSLCDSLYSKSNFQTFYDTSHLETTCWVRVCLHGVSAGKRRQNPPGFLTNLWEIAVCWTNLSLPKKMQLGFIFKGRSNRFESKRDKHLHPFLVWRLRSIRTYETLKLQNDEWLVGGWKQGNILKFEQFLQIFVINDDMSCSEWEFPSHVRRENNLQSPKKTFHPRIVCECRTICKRSRIVFQAHRCSVALAVSFQGSKGRSLKPLEDYY